MTEKTTFPEPEYDADTVQPDSMVGERDQSDQLSDDGAKRRINGGTLAWLNVLAGFCIFVNSWCVDSFLRLSLIFYLITRADDLVQGSPYYLWRVSRVLPD